MKNAVAAILLLAAPAVAQDFRPSVLVSRDSAGTTIDMCASAGSNLRFGWDYDNDGADDQRGPCRRTVSPAGPVRVVVWEAVGGGGGHYEETVWPALPSVASFAPRATANKTLAYLDDGLIIFSTCETSSALPVVSSFDLNGDGVDDQVGEDCYAKIEIALPGAVVVRVTITSGSDQYIEYFPIVILPGARP